MDGFGNAAYYTTCSKGYDVLAVIPGIHGQDGITPRRCQRQSRSRYNINWERPAFPLRSLRLRSVSPLRPVRALATSSVFLIFNLLHFAGSWWLLRPMYSNQQPHSSGGNYQHQHPNSSGLPPFGTTTSLRHQTNYPRSSSVSSASGYQQVASPAEFDNRDMHRQHTYGHSSIYTTDSHHQYTTSPQTPGAPIPPFQTPAHRSGADGITYAMGNSDLNGTTAFRRTGQPMQPGGPSRARTMSLSYAQPTAPGRSPSADYSQAKYPHDPRYAHPYPPPTSYRARAASPPPASHPPSRPAPSRMNSTPISHQDAHTRHSPLTTQPPAHPLPRRDSSASSTSPSYQSRAVPVEGGASSTSPANQPRPHVCDMCGLAFVRGHDLKRHKDTHTNSKPHVCDCGKSFSRKDALKRHVYLKSCRGEKSNGYGTSEE